MDDLLIACPECMVPNQVSPKVVDSTMASLNKPGSGGYLEKTVECSNCSERYTVYLSESRE
jgi:hypothetical protein